MDYHQVLQWAGGLLALLLFIPFVREVLKHPEGQSCATWMLWGALDTILTISLLRQHGNFLLALGFAIGDVVLVALLLARGRFQWGRFETVILILMLGCLLAWKIGGPKTATVASTLGVCIALVPGVIALWKNPQPSVGKVWAGYGVANLISFFGGRAMTIEERFAPAMFTLCAVTMVLASRRMRVSDGLKRTT